MICIVGMIQSLRTKLGLHRVLVIIDVIYEIDLRMTLGRGFCYAVYADIEIFKHFYA